MSGREDRPHPRQLLKDRLVAEEHGLTLPELAILHTIASYVNFEGVAWPGRATISAQSGASVRTVDTHIAQLIRKGFLERWREGHEGLHPHSIYRILTERQAGSSASDEPKPAQRVGDSRHDGQNRASDGKVGADDGKCDGKVGADDALRPATQDVEGSDEVCEVEEAGPTSCLRCSGTRRVHVDCEDWAAGEEVDCPECADTETACEAVAI